MLTSIRILFLVACTTMGAVFIYTFIEPITIPLVILGASAGLVIGSIIVLLENTVQNISLKGLSSAIFGLFFGLLLSIIVAFFVNMSPLEPRSRLATIFATTAILCYFGIMLALRGKDEFSLVIPYIRLHRIGEVEQITLLDTNVIIDGRIAEICQTNFIDGKVVVPRFVLKELQQIADSEDSLKKQRGKRGLDILSRIKKHSKVEIIINEEDIPGVNDVDSKLVSLAKVFKAKILTNDYNLNKIAEIQGVKTLNINELAIALKTVVFPGEELQIKIIKEGKEEDQGVGYLDDGTMVVVENGKDLVGQTCILNVENVLQTPSGRMIFAKSKTMKR